MKYKLIALFAAAALLAHAEEKSQIKLTKQEQEIVKEAKKTFAKSKGKPAFSKHMQDKMQSGVSDPEPSETKSK